MLMHYGHERAQSMTSTIGSGRPVRSWHISDLPTHNTASASRALKAAASAGPHWPCMSPTTASLTRLLLRDMTDCDCSCGCLLLALPPAVATAAAVPASEADRLQPTYGEPWLMSRCLALVMTKAPPYCSWHERNALSNCMQIFRSGLSVYDKLIPCTAEFSYV